MSREATLRTAMIDVEKLVKAQGRFHAQMLFAMLAAFDQGKRGWDDPDCKFWFGNFEEEILSRVQAKVREGAEGNEVDIANYMMMLKYMRDLLSSKAEGDK